MNFGRVRAQTSGASPIVFTDNRTGTTDTTASVAGEDKLRNKTGAVEGTYIFDAEDTRNVLSGNIDGDGWTVDLPMVDQGDGTWKTDKAYALDGSTEFKVRQGKSWDVNYGLDGALNGANITIEGLGVEAGNYFVVLDTATGIVTVVAG